MSKIIILVKSDKLTAVQRNGKDPIMKQEAALENGDGFPLPFMFVTDTPYKPGRYTLSPESFRLGSFQSLELNPFGIRLDPVS